jgi:hypothetical protein
MKKTAQNADTARLANSLHTTADRLTADGNRAEAARYATTANALAYLEHVGVASEDIAKAVPYLLTLDPLYDGRHGRPCFAILTGTGYVTVARPRENPTELRLYLFDPVGQAYATFKGDEVITD